MVCSRAEKVYDLCSPKHQSVGNVAAMASPPQRFGAHDGKWRLGPRVGLHSVDRGAELLRVHVVGVRLERRAAKGAVTRGLLTLLLRPPRSSPLQSYSMPTSPNEASRPSLLNCEWRREPGKRRTSIR